MLAAGLALCLLFTTYPDILATLSALAAGTQGDPLYVTGFKELPEGVREQTVPLGTGIEGLTLPDTLEAYITVEEEAPEEEPAAEEDSDGSGSKENNTVSSAETGDGSAEGTGTDETGDGTDADGSTETGAGTGGTGTDETGGNGDGTDGGTGTDDNTGEGGEGTDGDNSGDSTGSTGDNTENTGGTGAGTGAGTGTGGTGGNGSNDDNGSADNNGDNTDADSNDNTGSSSGDNTGSSNGGSADNNGDTGDTGDTGSTGNTGSTEAQQEQSAPEQTNGESAPQAKAGHAAFSQETHTVTLPVYAAGNEPDIETLELSPAGESDNADTDAAADTDKVPADTESSTYAAPQESRTAQTEQITIENITWESNPSYDAETEGVYIFTPVLPEGYALSDGVSLPEIRVEAVMTGEIWTEEDEARMRAGLQDNPALLTEADVLAAAPELAPMTYGLSRAAAAGNPGTYLTTKDNEDNAGSGAADGDLDNQMRIWWDNYPIEANIFIPEGKLPRKSCYLAVRAYSVCSQGGGWGPNGKCVEYDKVFVNGEQVGVLTGGYGDWSISYFLVPFSCLREGKNTVRVEIWTCTDKDRFGDDEPPLDSKQINEYCAWIPTIDWMQLVCDGGAGAGSGAGGETISLALKPKDCSLSDAWVNVAVETVIDSNASSAEYDAEYSIMDSKGFFVAPGQKQDVQDGSHKITIKMLRSSPEGIYTVQGMLKKKEDGTILATDSVRFRYIQDKGVVIIPQISHTLSIETLTRQDVTVTPEVEDAMGCTDVKISPASTTATKNGKYDFTVTYRDTSGKSDSFTYTAQVENIDKTPPAITYNSAAVISAETMEAVKEQMEKAWTITDNVSSGENCTVTYSPDCSKEAGFKKLRQAAGGTINVTVTATDEVGNKSSDTRALKVAPLPLELGVPTAARNGTASTFTLTAEVLAAAGTVTESGFVWGTMQNPTLSFNQGSGKNTLDVKTGNKIQVKAADIVDGVTYYCRAYAVAGGVTYYSEQASFGINAKSYGTFTVTNNNTSTFTITRTGGTDGAQTVYYRTVNGSAVGGTHFEHKAGTAVFGQGETKKTVTVTEKGVAAAYNSKTATSYSNADRTYSFEIYRVDGGGTLGDTVSAQRTMTKNSSYTVSRDRYTTDNPRNVAVNDNNKWVADGPGKKWHAILFVNGRGKNTGQGGKNFNVQRTLEAGTARETAYLKATATGYYYRIDMNATETDNGYEHVWISNHAPNNMKSPDTDVHENGTAIPLDYSYFGHAFCTGRWEINYHHTGTKDAYFPSGKNMQTGWLTENIKLNYDSSRITSDNNWVVFNADETAHVWFAASGNNKNMWYLNSYTDYVKVKDTKEPQWIGTAPMAGGTYKPGDAVVVSLIFDEIVDSKNSDLGDVSINTSWGTFSYAGGADTNVLYFKGTVPSNATGTLKVNSINGTDKIKDMCDDKGSAPSGKRNLSY